MRLIYLQWIQFPLHLIQIFKVNMWSTYFRLKTLKKNITLFLNVQVIVPKMKGELLGVVIVESGWGSMVPTVVLANMSANGPSARCGQLNIGDQIISVNGISLVGLPLSTCQTYIKVSWFTVFSPFHSDLFSPTY